MGSEMCIRDSLCAGLCVRCCREDFLPVEVVHRENQVKIPEVPGRYFPGGTADRDTPSFEGVTHPAVGRLAGVGIDSACRVTGDPTLHCRFFEEVPKYIFPCRRAADVTPAHKKNAESTQLLHGSKDDGEGRTMQGPSGFPSLTSHKSHDFKCTVVNFATFCSSLGWIGSIYNT